METPREQQEISTMMHEEKEEMQHDISELWDQVQQILLSQRVTKNEMEDKMDNLKNILKSYMEGLKDVIEEKMKANMEDLNNGLKEDMEGLKEGLTKLLQEMLPNGENVLDEIHDEEKINLNHDSIDSSIGFNTHDIPNIDMRKFDGK